MDAKYYVEIRMSECRLRWPSWCNLMLLQATSTLSLVGACQQLLIGCHYNRISSVPNKGKNVSQLAPSWLLKGGRQATLWCHIRLRPPACVHFYISFGLGLSSCTTAGASCQLHSCHFHPLLNCSLSTAVDGAKVFNMSRLCIFFFTKISDTTLL